MNRRILYPTLLSLLVATTAMLVQACGSPDTRNNGPAAEQPSTAEPTVQTSPKPAFERDLDFIRKGRFTYVWVFSRKDGEPLDKEDGAFLRKHADQVVDWVTTDEGRRFIAGSNFDFEKDNLDLLRKRFVIEDYSGK